MTILDELSAYAKKRVEEAKEKIPLDAIREKANVLPKGSFEFESALKKDDISFICECKKASPSKGLIAPEFPYIKIAAEYEAAGADAVSVLTEPSRFLGSDSYLKEISEAVSIPCLRKDFTVDEYMLYEAKLLGASSVLLICAILTEKLRGQLSSKITPVGVFAGEEIKNIEHLINKGIISVVQLHGSEDNEYIRRLRRNLSCPVVLFTASFLDYFIKYRRLFLRFFRFLCNISELFFQLRIEFHSLWCC